MITFGVKSDVVKAALAVQKLGDRQVPYATSLALNRTAELALDVLRSAVRREFDRPTPFVLNSMYRTFATKSKLEVTLGHKRAGGKKHDVSGYLRPHIEGGQRPRRASEKSRVLGNYWVPGPGIQLDQYGNVPGGQMKRILSSLGKADYMSGYTSNRSRKSGERQKRKGKFQDLFIIPLGQGNQTKPPGVYQRIGEKVVALLYFVHRPPVYQARYDLEGMVDRTFKAEFNKQFAAAMDYALSTSKGVDLVR